MISALLFAAVLQTAAAPAGAAFVTHVQDSYPALSPDGRTLVFQSNRNGRRALYLADSDGAHVRLLLDSGDDPATPSWSPDGHTIAFAATADGNSEVFVINADGTQRRRLTRDPADDSHPHFARTGRLFFNSGMEHPSGEVDEIYSMNVDGSDRRQHTHCNAICTFPSPSPDGRWLAYRRVIAGLGRNWSQATVDNNSEVFVQRMNGSGVRNLSLDPAFDGWPVWSPNSQWVVFSSGRDGAPLTGQVYAIHPDGTGLRRVTQGPLSNVQPYVAPDGASVLTYWVHESEEAEAGSIARWPFAP